MIAPVSAGDEIEVEVDAQGAKGDGIAHYENFVIFVQHASVGQKVKVRIVSVHRTYALGEII